MKMTEVSTLNILLHNKKIGVLTLLPNEQTIFTFDEEYANNKNKKTLSLSLEDKNGDFIPFMKPSRIQLPPFFSNLLPEGPLRDFLATHAKVNSKREFFLLKALGQDLPGAISAQPDKDEINHFNLESNVEENTNDIMRFSLAGVQLKFSGVLKPKGGLTIPAKGIGGDWIVKLPSSRFENVPENEFSMMNLAAKLGMAIPEIRLLPLNKISGLPDDLGRLYGENALIIKRFDRVDNGKKIHIEDFAQVFGVYPEQKYEKASYKNIAEVISARVGVRGVEEFIKRLVFNTLIGNADMHLKNWSLIYLDGVTPSLSPGYDFLSTLPYIHDKTMALNFVKTKLMSDLSVDLLKYLAQKATLPERLVIKTAKDVVVRFKDGWSANKADLLMDKEAIKAIEDNFKNIVLYNQF